MGKIAEQLEKIGTDYLLKRKNIKGEYQQVCIVLFREMTPILEKYILDKKPKDKKAMRDEQGYLECHADGYMEALKEWTDNMEGKS